jgi:hypothetical protein
MGCDIHVCVESLKTVHGKTEWRNVDFFQRNPYFGSEYEPEWNLVSCFTERNYSLFALLADVRNRAGNKPISAPRGLPKDVSLVTKNISDHWGEDGHSHSWFTIKELMDAEGVQGTINESGMISKEAFALLQNEGKLPEEWCQYTNQKDYVHATWVRPFKALTALIDSVLSRVDPYAASSGYPTEEVRKHVNPEKSRIIFWFDN